MPSLGHSYAPDLEKYLRSLKGQPLVASVEKLVSLLKRRQIQGSEPCAIATAHILLQVVARSKWADVEALLQNVRDTGRRIVRAQPHELVVGNIVRRVLALIRDEAAEDRNGSQSESQSEAQMTPTESLSMHNSSATLGDAAPSGPVASSARPTLAKSLSTISLPKSLFNLLSLSGPTDVSPARSPMLHQSGTSTPANRIPLVPNQIHSLRTEVIGGIEEMMDEISQVDEQIASVADVHIHPTDRVAVHRPCATVERFILRAAAKRNFTVYIIVESPQGESLESQNGRFRKKLLAAGIESVNVCSAGVMNIMPCVTKVILGARAVLSDGGVLIDSGATVLARAAKTMCKPVIVLTGIYKLSPIDFPDAERAIEWGYPDARFDMKNDHLGEDVQVQDALTGIVPAENIDVYITNLGAHSRSHFPMLIDDHYYHEDIDFNLES